jgi:hypothetical protein
MPQYQRTLGYGSGQLRSGIVGTQAGRRGSPSRSANHREA